MCPGSQGWSPNTKTTNNYEWMNKLHRQAPANWENLHKSLREGCSWSSASHLRPHVIVSLMPPEFSPAHSAALHCKCWALVTLKPSWITYSFCIALWALSPGNSAPEWTGLSCSSSWNIIMYQQAGFTSGGLGWPDLAKILKCVPCTALLSSWESSWHLSGMLLAFKMLSKLVLALSFAQKER